MRHAHILIAIAGAAGLWAQAQLPAFEVASIRPHPPAVNAPVFKNPDVNPNPIRISGNRVELDMIGLKQLVMAAYNVKEYQVSGGPGWASRLDSMWNIAAKAPGDGPASMDQARLMLQNLLAERFHLKLRRETKTLPVYNLVVAKNGPKLRKAAEAPPAPGMRRGSMDQLAALLSLLLDRPVIDKTGLAGSYDYSTALALLDVGAQDSADTIGRTLTAIQDQLGLKAQPAKARIGMLVIESADRPSEN